MPFIQDQVFRRIFKSAFFLIASCFLLHSQTTQPSNTTTEVIIIGTVHKSTETFKANDLTAILTRVRPDLILFEYDSSFFTKDFQFVRNFGGLEQTAVIAYMKDHQVALRPYDIEDRNDFYRANNSFEREDTLLKNISELAKSNKLDLESQKILERIHKCLSERDQFLTAAPRDINSFECDRILAQKAYVMDFGYSEIIHRNHELVAFRDFWNRYAAFESQRNLLMIKHIEEWAKEFSGKRIVVLCGFEHRHQLRFGLRISSKLPILVKEYWELLEPFPA